MRSKGKKISFEELTVGHVFTFDSRLRLKEKDYFWCEFCGGRGQKIVRLKRDDGLIVEVGERCMSKVKYVVPEGMQTEETLPVEPQTVNVEEGKKTEEVTDEALNALFEDIEKS